MQLEVKQASYSRIEQKNSTFNKILLLFEPRSWHQLSKFLRALAYLMLAVSYSELNVNSQAANQLIKFKGVGGFVKFILKGHFNSFNVASRAGF